MPLEGTVTTNAERLALHKRRMKNAAFRRISMWVPGELAEMLAKERRQRFVGHDLAQLPIGTVSRLSLQHVVQGRFGPA